MWALILKSSVTFKVPKNIRNATETKSNTLKS